MRTIATVSDIYGSDAGSTFFNRINGAEAGMAGTGQDASGGPDQAGGTSASVASAIQPVQIASSIEGTLWGNGVMQFCIIIVAVIGVYALAKKHVPNLESDLAVPRVSLSSFWSIGFQAFIFFVLIKTVLKKYNVPGLSGLVAAA